jgi:hypothetical protein
LSERAPLKPRRKLIYSLAFSLVRFSHHHVSRGGVCGVGTTFFLAFCLYGTSLNAGGGPGNYALRAKW